jgi:hypothetical protein
MRGSSDPRVTVPPPTSPKGHPVTRTFLCVALLACACDSGAKTETKTETKSETKTETKSESAEKTATPPADSKTTAAADVKTAPITAKTVAAADTPDPAAARDAKTADKAAQAAAVGDATKAGDRVKAPDAATPPAEPAAGGTVAQKEGWANYEKELGQKIGQVNKACGSSLSGSYDKSTYTDFDPMKDRTQSACEQAVGTLSAVCASEPGKESVKKLKKTTCKFSTSGTGVAVSGSTLVIKIDPVKSSITGKEAGSYSWASAIKEVI